MRFLLQTPEGTIPLRTGELVIGRGVTCDIVLDDAQVSRQHARLTITSEGVSVTDIASVNGSYVNGTRVQGVRALVAGDRLKFGHIEVVLIAQRESFGPARRTEPLACGEAPLLGEEDIPTRRTDALEVVGAGAEMAYAQGRPEQAELFLSGYLATVLVEIQAGRPLPDRTVLEAIQLALRLAAKIEKGAWFDYVIELLLAHGVLPPEALIDDLTELAEKLKVDAELFSRYLDRLANTNLGAEEQRIHRRLSLLRTRLQR